MTNKEIAYGDYTRQATRKAKASRKQKKKPFPSIYANAPEDYELYETESSQIDALMVECGILGFKTTI